MFKNAEGNAMNVPEFLGFSCLPDQERRIMPGIAIGHAAVLQVNDSGNEGYEHLIRIFPAYLLVNFINTLVQRNTQGDP